MKQLKVLSVVSIGLTLVLALWVTKLTFAHGGDTNLVHACVKASNGNIRIIGTTDTCGTGETALDWSRNGVGDFGGFTTNQLVGINLNSENLDYRDLAGANFTDANFHTVNMSNADLSGADFTNALMDGSTIINTDFTGANFTNVLLDGTILTSSNFTGSNLTDANLTNANLANVVGLNTANLVGVVWSNTICPDGTNSDANGGTCDGHFVP